jgi:hypothetical protein
MSKATATQSKSWLHSSIHSSSDATSSRRIRPPLVNSTAQKITNVSLEPTHPPAGVYKVPLASGHVKLDGVAVTHKLVVAEDSVSGLGTVVVAPDVYAIGDVSPDVTFEVGKRLETCEET